jgi:hypothetical protein
MTMVIFFRILLEIEFVCFRSPEKHLHQKQQKKLKQQHPNLENMLNLKVLMNIHVSIQLIVQN